MRIEKQIESQAERQEIIKLYAKSVYTVTLSVIGISNHEELYQYLSRRNKMVPDTDLILADYVNELYDKAEAKLSNG